MMKKLQKFHHFIHPQVFMIPINDNDDDEHKKHTIIDAPLHFKELYNTMQHFIRNNGK